MAEADCFGQYGLGAAIGRDCNTCPQNQPCWDEHRVRVKAGQPEAVAEFESLVEGLRPTWGDRAGQMAVAALASRGRCDPYTQAMLENIRRGLMARGVPRN
ncbi:MAG: hypothetical protein HPY69_21060 [Armatimonadetes bacterium]|nr:hypothetical protein [Armatimonadota bacterium]